MENSKKDTTSRLWKTILNVAIAIGGLVTLPTNLYSVAVALKIADPARRPSICNIKV